MSLTHLDNPGAVRWFSGYVPAEVLGDCPHSGCEHRGTGVVAWGPDLRHYELIECGIIGDDDGTDCAGNCRAWTNERGKVTTQWLHVAVVPMSKASTAQLAEVASQLAVDPGVVTTP